MTNFQVYKKVLPFSLIQFFVDLGILAVLGGSCVGGFFIADKATNKGLIGLAIGLVVGIILAILLNVFVSNRIKAAQIAMMVKGVTDGKLPDHVLGEGFNEVKGRFGKITLFFFITGAIKGIFNQLGRAITKLGSAIGGDVGGGIASAVNSAIQTVISYLCDCCLGWILYRKEQNSVTAACEGTVIFFKHGKALARNVGRIFGLGLGSLLLIGGAFFGLLVLIFFQLPAMFQTLANEILEAANRGDVEVPGFLTDPKILSIIVAAVGAIIIWSMIHAMLIRPFILVGVLRNFMEAGRKDIPVESDFAALEAQSPRFSRFRRKAAEKGN